MGEVMETVGELTREQLMAQVYESLGPTRREDLPQPNFTAREFMAQYPGLTIDQARDKLNRQVADGLLDSAKVGREIAYWRV